MIMVRLLNFHTFLKTEFKKIVLFFTFFLKLLTNTNIWKKKKPEEPNKPKIIRNFQPVENQAKVFFQGSEQEQFASGWIMLENTLELSQKFIFDELKYTFQLSQNLLSEYLLYWVEWDKDQLKIKKLQNENDFIYIHTFEPIRIIVLHNSILPNKLKTDQNFMNWINNSKRAQFT